MNVNLAHAGMDQRKAHVVARQVAGKLIINPLKNSKGETISPVAIHHNLIAGLSGPEQVDLSQNREDIGIDLKMSKSKPGSAIFIHDSQDEIREKIRKAYGPPQDIDYNPLINWVETLVFWGEKEGSFTINRPQRYGGNVTYTNVDNLIDDYKSGKLFPLDLKNSLADWLVKKLEPARKHFEGEKAREGLKMIKTWLS
jgi:tyrosyl-tRNA synthetase